MRYNVSPFALLWGLLSLALLTAFPMCALAAGTGTITGLVTDTSNNIMAGATVVAGGINTVTDSTGHYTLSSIPIGNQLVGALRILYTETTTTVNVIQNTTITAPTLMLKPNWGSFSGYVWNAVTSAPISGATISLQSPSLSTTTDATGHYTFAQAPVGSKAYIVSATGYVQTSQTVNVVLGGTATVNVNLTPSASTLGSITGNVKDATTSAAIPGANLSLTGTSLKATTDSSGHYTIASVPAGSQTITISASGYQSASQTTNVVAANTATVNFALAPVVVSGAGSTILWNGVNNYLLGVNYAWYNYGTDFGTGGWGKFTSWSSVGTGFSALTGQGARVVRFWVFADGRYSPDFNSDGTVSGLDSSVLTDVDQILQIAANTNTYLLLTVIDASMWSNASFNGSVQMGGHSALVTNAATQQTFLDNALKPLLQHIAASPHKNNVLGYDIVNEPEANMSGYWGGVNLAASQVQTFVQKCATYIHNYGGGGYATVGSATPYYVGAWKNLGLDFYQVHYYPWMDFSNGAGSGLPTYASLNLDKPCIVGEYPTADANYTLGSVTPLSAQWYLDSIYNKGYAGGLGWSYFVGDSASKWTSFQPIFTNWANTHGGTIGPK